MKSETCICILYAPKEGKPVYFKKMSPEGHQRRESDESLKRLTSQRDDENFCDELQHVYIFSINTPSESLFKTLSPDKSPFHLQEAC